MRINKKLLAVMIAAALALLIFLFYPSLLQGINRIAFAGNRKDLKAEIKKVGGEIYSQKTKFGTDMWYLYEDGYVLNFYSEYAAVFKSSKSYEEICKALSWEYIIPLSDADRPFMADKAINALKKPPQTEGYYVLGAMPAPKISEVKATKAHTFIYSDKQNRKDVNDEKKYVDENKEEIEEMNKKLEELERQKRNGN